MRAKACLRAISFAFSAPSSDRGGRGRAWGREMLNPGAAPLPYAVGMNLRVEVEHRQGYSVVRLRGEPSLGQFLSFVQLIGVETSGWTVRRVLFDLRGIRNFTSFTEHYAIGEETARQLHHLHRIASVVDADMITRASEKTARRSGVNLTVFTDEGEAVRWLTA